MTINVVAHMSPCLMAIPLELFALSLIYPLFQVFKSKNTATRLFSCGFIRVRNQLHGSFKILKPDGVEALCYCIKSLIHYFA